MKIEVQASSIARSVAGPLHASTLSGLMIDSVLTVGAAAGWAWCPDRRVESGSTCVHKMTPPTAGKRRAGREGSHGLGARLVHDGNLEGLAARQCHARFDSVSVSIP
jgi:hypothetical protein